MSNPKFTVGMLTYKTHLDKAEFEEWIRGEFPKNELKVAIAHETGDETDPYEHTHVVIHFGKSTTISKTRVQKGFDYKGIHPNWKGMSGRTAWKDGLKYITKEDTDVGHEVEEDFTDVIHKIWRCDTVQDALLLCKKPQDVLPYLALYRNKCESQRHMEYNESFFEAPLRENQQMWLDRLDRQDDRKILWICDYECGAGKSWFGKWLRVNRGAEKMRMSTKAINFMYQGSEYVYINIAKSLEEGYVSYTAIEELKDGDMISDKYEGRSILYAPPKVVVFANFYPDTHKMARDRWDIIEEGGHTHGGHRGLLTLNNAPVELPAGLQAQWEQIRRFT